jgi:Flp pilus assembly pilin Flp
MIFLLRSIQLNERAQGLLEYALLIAAIALIVVVAMLLIGPEVGGAFSNVGSAME